MGVLHSLHYTIQSMLVTLVYNRVEVYYNIAFRQLMQVQQVS